MNDLIPRPSSTRQFWQRWSRAICAYPRLVVALGFLLGAGAITLTAMRLEFQPNRNDLISSDLAWNQRFIEWRSAFPGARDLFVVIDQGEDASKAPIAEAFAREVLEWLERDDSIQSIEWGARVGAFSARAARLLPLEDLQAMLEPVAQAEPIVLASDLSALIARITGELVREQASLEGDAESAARAIERLSGLIRGMTLEVTRRDEGGLARWILAQASPQGADPGAWQSLLSPNGRFIVMRVTPRTDQGTLNELAPTVRNIRSVLRMLSQSYPEIEAGLTGIEAIEADETEVATRDSAIASVIALGLIALILVTAFHSVRTPMLLVISLLFGVAWSFGYLTLAIGHLQILSVVFVVILLGLGIDFGIHLASTFEIVRHAHPEESFREAMGDALATIAPGVVTGAVTTAAAFFITSLTDFKGVAEMGLIAGGGVLLCLIAMLTIFPALKRLYSSSKEHVRALDDRSLHLYEERWSMPFVRAPKVTLALTLILVALAGVSALRIGFDYDLPALLPEGMPSVEWQERLSDEGGVSIWAATSIVGSLEEARRRRHEFLALPTVASVGGIGVIFPENEGDKLAAIRSAREGFGETVLAVLDESGAPADGPGDPDALIGQITLLRTGLDQALPRTDLPASLRPALEDTSLALSELMNALGPMTPAEARAGLARAEASYDVARTALIGQLGALLDLGSMQPSDLPPAFTRGAISHSGDRLALKIHPALPEDGTISSPLDPRFLRAFMEDLESVDPEVTGVVVQFHKSGDLIRASFLWAGGAALVLVLVIVAGVFRSIVDALLALAPVAIAFVLTFGLMQVLGVDVNPANIVVLPLLFGIGIDAGVHIIHRYREDPSRRPRGMTLGTGKGITVTSLTTIVGFAAMLIADHRGIASLGLVLTIGIAMTMLACWIILPALLELRGEGESTSTG